MEYEILPYVDTNSAQTEPHQATEGRGGKLV